MSLASCPLHTLIPIFFRSRGRRHFVKRPFAEVSVLILARGELFPGYTDDPGGLLCCAGKKLLQRRWISSSTPFLSHPLVAIHRPPPPRRCYVDKLPQTPLSKNNNNNNDIKRGRARTQSGK